MTDYHSLPCVLRPLVRGPVVGVVSQSGLGLQGRDYLRYYQDASIRASLTRIIVQRGKHQPPRVLLAIATGGGKSRPKRSGPMTSRT